MRRILTAGLLLLATACKTGTGPEEADVAGQLAAVSTPIEITLEVGQERTIEGTVIELSFLRVTEDSRCPRNVVCVWAGDGVAELGIAAGDGPTTAFKLHTTLEPKVADWNGVRVTLVELAPAPPTGAKDYLVKLRVEPAK